MPRRRPGTVSSADSPAFNASTLPYIERTDTIAMYTLGAGADARSEEAKWQRLEHGHRDASLLAPPPKPQPPGGLMHGTALQERAQRFDSSIA